MLLKIVWQTRSKAEIQGPKNQSKEDEIKILEVINP